jgi:hypothetical protein
MVARLASEIATTARQFGEDFREAFLEVNQPAGGRPRVWVKKLKGNTSDPTGDTVADREHRLYDLAEGAKEFEIALKTIREARGHVHKAFGKKESKGSSWTARELAETEARARDKKRGYKRPRVG